MEEEHWSLRDFTEIKPRRPEGKSECEEWESKPFSFIWPLGGDSQEQDSMNDDRNLHRDLGNTNLESEDQEFEFNSVSATVVERINPSGISPADELFFKGQLLPLHLPPRIQMVKQLSLTKQQTLQQQQDEEEDQREKSQSNEDHDHVGMIETTPLKFARLFQTKYNKFCINSNNDVQSLNSTQPRSNGWWDPREARDSTSSASTDRDSSGDSSSSRDSNGSSQDCFDSSSTSSKDFQSTVDSKGFSFLHNREVFSTHSALPDRSAIPTWLLRPPFKWKVLFGAKKTSISIAKPASTPMFQADESKSPRSQQVPEYFSGSPPRSDRYYSDCSGELTFSPAFSGDLSLTARGFERTSFDKSVGDPKDYSHGMAKAKEYLNKYMKVLKPLATLKKDNSALLYNASHDLATARTSSASTPAISTTHNPSASLTPLEKRDRHGRHISSSRSFPAFSQSSRFSPKDVPSTPRKSTPSTPRGGGAGARPVSTPSSTYSELHSAIQGAIKHCKESQAREDVPAASDLR